MFDVSTFQRTLRDNLKAQKTDFFHHLLNEALDILKAEPSFLSIEIQSSFVVGDTHGDIISTLAVIEKTLNRGNDQQVIFLGDYVDRSEQDIINFHLVLEFKKTAPNRVFLLRGNHETPEINSRYGFQDNLVINGLDSLKPLYLQVMGELPLAAQLGKTFLVHGGIAENLSSLDQIRALKKTVAPKDPPTLQLLWNDPVESIEGFELNIFRGSNVLMFGSKAFQSFMEANDFDYFIRSHVPYPGGYTWLFNEKLLSIFTCNQEPYFKPRVIAETDGETKPTVLHLDSL